MRGFSHRRGRFASIESLAVGLLTIGWPSSASAHVKWFAHYDVAGSLQPLAAVLSPTFFLLFGCAILTLWLTCLIEGTAIGVTLLQTFARIGKAACPRTEEFLRACAGGFFVALWVLGGVILTPELKTASPVIPWLQAAIAVGMFWRGGMFFSALGMVALFGIGIWNYGIFHMLDYPIFLGLAAYFALSSIGRNLFGLRPIDVARWGAGITLMWASIEKWGFPEWTYPLLRQHPDIAMGWNPHFYMTAAGVIEFALAFGLLWTPLVRRLSAVVLAAMFISAVFEFGKIDAIGHSMIVAILVAILVDEEPSPPRLPSWLAPVMCCAAVTVTMLAYYGIHALIYGTVHV